MSLRKELDNPRSGVRAFFEDNLPLHLDVLGAVRAELGDSVLIAPPHPEGLPRPPTDVLGHAHDTLVHRRLGSTTVSRAAVNGARVIASAYGGSVVEELVGEREALGVSWELQREAAVAFLLGLCERAFRSWAASEPWYMLFGMDGLDAAVDAVPDWAVDDLVRLSTVNEEIFDALASAHPIHFGPEFVASATVGGADADLIAADLLVEMKAGTSSLVGRDVRQLVSYALLDSVDEYGVRSLGFLLLRHARLIQWPAAELVSMLGSTSTLAELRTRFAAMLDRFYAR